MTKQCDQSKNSSYSLSVMTVNHYLQARVIVSRVVMTNSKRSIMIRKIQTPSPWLFLHGESDDCCVPFFFVNNSKFVMRLVLLSTILGLGLGCY